MVPGLGFLYSGLARRKSALSLMWACMVAGSVINFQWYFWGFSLTFSASATNGFIGDLAHFGLKGVLGAPSIGSPLIPNLLYAFYQVWLPLSCSQGASSDVNTDAILRRHRSHYCRCRCRTRATVAILRLAFPLGYSRLQPTCMLGMESEWMGLRIWCS